MKITNKSVVTLLFRIYGVILVFVTFIFFGLLLVSPEIFSKIKYWGLVIMIYSFVKILGLKYIEYENSGEVLSLKSYKLFRKKNQGKHIEMPVDKIKTLCIERKFWINYLIINIERSNKKIKIIHFPIDHIKRSDLMIIKDNFKN